MMRYTTLVPLILSLACSSPTPADHLRALQTQAVTDGRADFGHWGWDAENYLQWGTHSNRLVPVYTFGTLNAGDGIDLNCYQGANSPYRSAAAVRQLYGYVPAGTVNPEADYLDQTNIFDLQMAALEAGKKHIILVIFDGMDWQTTRAASIAQLNRVAYESGRGTGLHFLDAAADGTTQFGFMVTSPYSDGAETNVDVQSVSVGDETERGGYAFESAGRTPWESPADPEYLVGKSKRPELRQAYTDSASSATSMTAGIKTYNAAINVDPHGSQVTPIAHVAQRLGYRIGVVTSVPISHATPAAAYAHNVKRHDYQDLTRDLLGLPSVTHPDVPLPGVDVLIGAGYGETRNQDDGQGENFQPGNAYLTDEDLQKSDRRAGGRYVVAIRSPGVDGAVQLREQATIAAADDQRLLGFFGVAKGHLPFQTADGNYDPPLGRKKEAERYTEDDIRENPTLAEMAEAALTVLSARDQPFWLMLEAGDVDWANHDDNIDNSIGAVLSGDSAVQAISQWVERESSWDETVLIVTADHGHFLVLEHPELLLSDQ